MIEYKLRFPYFIDGLNASDELFRILDIQHSQLNTKWLENNFPILSSGRINWNEVPNSISNQWNETSDLVDQFYQIVNTKKLTGKVIVAWDNMNILPIEIDMSICLKYAEDIFEESFDTWICCEKARWCVEVYHEGEICFGNCLLLES